MSDDIYPSPRAKNEIEKALDAVDGKCIDTFGNTNKNGNNLYEVVREWAEQRK